MTLLLIKATLVVIVYESNFGSKKNHHLHSELLSPFRTEVETGIITAKRISSIEIMIIATGFLKIAVSVVIRDRMALR